MRQTKKVRESKSYMLKSKMQDIIYYIFFYSLVLGICFAILYPLIKLIPKVLSDLGDIGNPDVIWIPKIFSLDSFRAAIRLVYKNGMPMVQSLVYSVTITLIQIFISAMAGYALGRVDFKGRDIVMFLVILTFVVPPQSLLISQYLHFKHFDPLRLISLFKGGTIDLINNPFILYLLAILGFGVKQSLFIFIFCQFFKGLPMELEEAALIDGCGFYRTYFKIALPNALPAIMIIATLGLVWNYGDTYFTGYFHPDGPYLSNTLIRTFHPNNVERVLYSLEVWFNVSDATVLSFDAVKHAAALIYLVPLLILYFIIQRHIVENLERTGIVG